jgi:hypothetical protein
MEDPASDAAVDAAAPTATSDGDEFMYEFLRMEMKRQREQRRAMRQERTSLIEIANRFRETERYRRELDAGKLTVTPEQAKAQNVNLMPHFEGVQLHNYRGTLFCKAMDEPAHRHTRRSNKQETFDCRARAKASRQYRKVARGADLLVKYMQKKFEESGKRWLISSGAALDEKKKDDEEIPVTTNNEDRLRDVVRQLARDFNDVVRNVDILDGQLALFARARERLDLRYRAAVGTRPDFLNDILLMTGGKPGEPYIKSVGNLSDGDA